MTLAKFYNKGRVQAVLLPENYLFKGDDEVIIKKIDGIVMLIPKKRIMATFAKSLSEFPEDFSIDRSNDFPQERV